MRIQRSSVLGGGGILSRRQTLEDFRRAASRGSMLSEGTFCTGYRTVIETGCQAQLRRERFCGRGGRAQARVRVPWRYNAVSSTCTQAQAYT